jgi:flavin reductase (DIM6/NTAB) family NADH-FMN oxidoreductase RutF
MSQIKIENNVFIPMPMGIIGTVVDGRANFMAAGWITRANARPPMIAAGIGSSHHTCRGIDASREFSVNIPGKNRLVETDFVGIVSGEKADKSSVFAVRYGELKNAPLIEDAIVSLECRLVESLRLPTNTLYVGEIIGAWAAPEYLEGSSVLYGKAGAFFLTMPDNRFWGFGEDLGRAWRIGKGYTPSK